MTRILKTAIVSAPQGWSVGLTPIAFEMTQPPASISLDFSDPMNSGFLAALLAGSSAPGSPTALDFTSPTNSGLVAAL